MIDARDVSDIVQELHGQGPTIVESIVAIHQKCNVPVDEPKRLVRTPAKWPLVANASGPQKDEFLREWNEGR